MKDENGTNVFMFLFMLPLLLVTGVFLVLAYMAGRVHAPRWIVSTLTLPSALLVGNVAAAGVMLCGSFSISLIFGEPSAFNWYMQHAFDLAGFSAWGPIVSHFWSFGLTDFAPKTSGALILLYQAAVYSCVGRFVHQLANRIIL